MSSSVERTRDRAVDVERALAVDGLMPTPEERDMFNKVTVVPAVPSCLYTFVLPDGWHSHVDPRTQERSLSGARFTALGVFSPEERIAPPLLVSFGAILVPEQGSVSAYFEEYCRSEGHEIVAKRQAQFLCGAVIDGLLSSRSPGGEELLIRLAMFEDAGRLFGLSAMAPAAMYDRAARILGLALTTFELHWPVGGTLPLE